MEDSNVVSGSHPRYFRIPYHKQSIKEEIIEEVSNRMVGEVYPVACCSHMFCVEDVESISTFNSSSDVVFMDLSSVICGKELMTPLPSGDDDHGGRSVIELCSAPGRKLGVIVDEIMKRKNEGEEGGRWTVVGCDISNPRLKLAKKHLVKHSILPFVSPCGLPLQMSLICADGSTLPSLFLTNSFSSTKTINSQEQEQEIVDNLKSITFLLHTLSEFNEAKLQFQTTSSPKNMSFENELDWWYNSNTKSRKKFRNKHLSTLQIINEEEKGEEEEDHQRRNLSSLFPFLYPTQESKESTEEEEDKRDLDGIGLFDRVLVDAECSHDGSFKHMSFFHSPNKNENVDEVEMKLSNENDSRPSQPPTKKQKLSPSPHKSSNIPSSSYQKPVDFRYQEEFGSHEMVQNLHNLQLKLIKSGFELLKVGGVMVYSTCSLMREQNEDVILALMEEINQHTTETPHISCQLLPLSFNHDHNLDNYMNVEEGRERTDLCQLMSEMDFVPSTSSSILPTCHYFNPHLHLTSGLFIAKLTKISSHNS